MKLLKIFIVSHLVFAQDRDANSLARDLDVDEAHRVRIFIHSQPSSDHREKKLSEPFTLKRFVLFKGFFDFIR